MPKYQKVSQRRDSKICSTWRSMMFRCYNKKAKGYENYGGRGIKVCERWHDYSAFYWDMNSTHDPNKSLDRIDVNGNYSPENCRWATTKEQANNRTTRVTYEWIGFTKSAPEWAEFLGVVKNDHLKFIQRLTAGLTIAEAIFYTEMSKYPSFKGRNRRTKGALICK